MTNFALLLSAPLVGQSSAAHRASYQSASLPVAVSQSASAPGTWIALAAVLCVTAGLIVVLLQLRRLRRRLVEANAATRSAQESNRLKSEFLANMSHESVRR